MQPRVILLEPMQVAAQQALLQTAMGIQAFEESRERCFYEEGVADVLAEVDAHFLRQNGYRWQKARELARAQIGSAIMNMQRALEPASPNNDETYCRSMAFPVASALVLGLTIVGPAHPGMKDLERLSAGTGRVK